MPTSILIGFEYKGEDYLPGTIIDLYHCYKWCNSFNCNIFIISDIIPKNCDYTIYNLQNMINLDIVKSDIFKFRKRIALSSKNFKQEKKQLNDILLERIISILSLISDNKLIIYYSGHGDKKGLVMPDSTTLSIIKLRDIILNNISKEVEILWILDCCNPNGIELPFRLKDNCFRLSDHKINCIENKILLITSSEYDEKSIATEYGSLFSRYLFKLLTLLNIQNYEIGDDMTIPLSKNRNLRRLIGNLASSIRQIQTGYSQTVSIYSSYVIDPVLWLWIGSKKNYDIMVESDYFIIKNITENNNNKRTEFIFINSDIKNKLISDNNILFKNV